MARLNIYTFDGVMPLSATNSAYRSPGIGKSCSLSTAAIRRPSGEKLNAKTPSAPPESRVATRTASCALKTQILRRLPAATKTARSGMAG